MPTVEVHADRDVGRFSTLRGPEGLPRRLIAKGWTSVLALADQAIVSATSLITTIIIGRYCGSEGLGHFALAFSILLLAMGAQVSLVSTPYTVFRLRRDNRLPPPIHAGATLASAILLVALISTATVVIATAITLSNLSATVVALSWALVLALPCYLAREFARRLDFAQFRMGSSLLLDSSVAVVQISLLLVLAWQGKLTSPLAILIVGLASGLSFAVWLTLRRGEFRIDRKSVAESIKHDWTFGRWLLADHLTCVAQLYVVHWLLTILMDAHETGILTAAASIAAFASPVLQGVGNSLSPKFAEISARRSRKSMMRLYWAASGLLAIPVLSFTVVMGVFGEQLLWLLYRDDAYSAYGGMVVLLLAIRLAVAIPTVAAEHAIIALENTRAGALATLAGLAATLSVAIPLIERWEVVGAATALLIGSVVEAIALLTLFARSLRRWSGEQGCIP